MYIYRERYIDREIYVERSTLFIWENNFTQCIGYFPTRKELQHQPRQKALVWEDKTYRIDVYGFREKGPCSLGPKGVYLALVSIQCFIIVSIAPESPDSKSAGCKAVTLGEIELFMF